MRRSARGRSNTGRTRRPTQWVTGLNSFAGNTQTAYTGNSLLTVQLLQTGTSQLTTGGDTFLMPQRFTILRVIGDFSFVNNSAIASAACSAGIILVDEVGSTGDLMNPSVNSNADKSWLWLAHQVVAPVAAVSGDFIWNCHFDVKVKRIMRPDQQLTFNFASGQDGSRCLNVRSLVARVA